MAAPAAPPVTLPGQMGGGIEMGGMSPMPQVETPVTPLAIAETAFAEPTPVITPVPEVAAGVLESASGPAHDVLANLGTADLAPEASAPAGADAAVADGLEDIDPETAFRDKAIAMSRAPGPDGPVHSSVSEGFRPNAQMEEALGGIKLDASSPGEGDIAATGAAETTPPDIFATPVEAPQPAGSPAAAETAPPADDAAGAEAQRREAIAKKVQQDVDVQFRNGIIDHTTDDEKAIAAKNAAQRREAASAKVAKDVRAQFGDGFIDNTTAEEREIAARNAAQQGEAEVSGAPSATEAAAPAAEPAAPAAEAPPPGPEAAASAPLLITNEVVTDFASARTPEDFDTLITKYPQLVTMYPNNLEIQTAAYRQQSGADNRNSAEPAGTAAAGAPGTPTAEGGTGAGNTTSGGAGTAAEGASGTGGNGTGATGSAEAGSGAGIPSTSGSAEQTPAQPATGPDQHAPAETTTAQQPTLTAEQNQQKQDIEARMRNGTESQADRDKLRQINRGQTDEQRAQELNERVIKGDELSPTEQAERDRLNQEIKGKKEADTPEGQKADLDKQVEDVGGKIIKDIADGKEVDPADLEKFRQLRIQQQLGEAGMTQQQAGELLRRALSGEFGDLDKRAKRELAIQREVKERLKELAAIEMQLMAIPRSVEALKEAKAKNNEAIGQAKTEIGGKIDPKNEKQRQVRMRLYALRMQGANIKAEATRIAYQAPVLEQKYREVSNYVDWRLGEKSTLKFALDWGKDRIARMFLDGAMDVDSLTNDTI